MGLPTGEVQTAVVAVHRADATLQGLLQAANAAVGAPDWHIFDTGGIRTGTQFPYLEVATIMTKSGTANAMGEDATDVFLQVKAFTRFGGFEQARALMSRVYLLTNQQSFVLQNGFDNFLTLFDHEIELQERDGITQQVTHRYLLMVQG